MTRFAALFGLGLVVCAIAIPAAQTPRPTLLNEAATEITFTKDIAPILQRSCQNCHRPDGVAPMSLRDLRRSAAVGARDQAAHRHRSAAPA